MLVLDSFMCLVQKFANVFQSSHFQPRALSHKSLQCEVVSRRDQYDVDQHPVRLRCDEPSRENVSKTRSHENFRGKHYVQEKTCSRGKHDKCMCCCEKDVLYNSKVNLTRSRMRNMEEDRYPPYPEQPVRNNVDTYRPRALDFREYKDYDREYVREKHYDDKRRYYDQKTSRSFDVHRDYREDEKFCRRTARSDNVRDKPYDDREKYYEEKKEPLDGRDRYVSNRERRVKRNVDRCDRNSVVSRDDEYRDRDRYSERERDSGLSVAECENSTVSGKSNYLRVVKVSMKEIIF
jgi:hypothetical protein